MFRKRPARSARNERTTRRSRSTQRSPRDACPTVGHRPSRRRRSRFEPKRCPTRRRPRFRKVQIERQPRRRTFPETLRKRQTVSAETARTLPSPREGRVRPVARVPRRSNRPRETKAPRDPPELPSPSFRKTANLPPFRSMFFRRRCRKPASAPSAPSARPSAPKPRARAGARSARRGPSGNARRRTSPSGPA